MQLAGLGAEAIGVTDVVSSSLGVSCATTTPWSDDGEGASRIAEKKEQEVQRQKAVWGRTGELLFSKYCTSSFFLPLQLPAHP